MPAAVTPENAFRIGQVFECTENFQTRQAIVLRTFANGQRALIRYVDTRLEEWINWSEFDHEKWRWAAGEQ
jgi:hypothetical protein